MFLGIGELRLEFILSLSIDTLYNLYRRDYSTIVKLYNMFKGNVKDSLPDFHTVKALCVRNGLSITDNIDEFFLEYDKVYLFKHDVSDLYIHQRWKLTYNSRELFYHLSINRRDEEMLSRSPDHLEAIVRRCCDDPRLALSYTRIT